MLRMPWRFYDHPSRCKSTRLDMIRGAKIPMPPDKGTHGAICLVADSRGASSSGLKYATRILFSYFHPTHNLLFLSLWATSIISVTVCRTVSLGCGGHTISTTTYGWVLNPASRSKATLAAQHPISLK